MALDKILAVFAREGWAGGRPQRPFRLQHGAGCTHASQPEITRLLTGKQLLAYYPPMSAADLLFKALADPGRRKLMDRLHAHDGQTLGELCRHLEMTRQGVTQHLAVL